MSKVIKVGQRYHKLGKTESYLLARVAPGEVVLINLTSANRWMNPVNVADPCKITEAEWRRITSRTRFVLTEAK